MFRFLDTSSTTQVAEIHVTHWRSSGSSWTKFQQSSTSAIAVGKTIRRSFSRTWMGKKYRIGNVCSFIENKAYFCKFLWMKLKAGKKNNLAPMEEIDENRGYWRTCIISWPHVFGMHSAGMQTRCGHHWTIHKNVWITYLCWSNREITGMAKTSRTNRSVVLRHGKTCSKMRWARQTRKWSNCTKFLILIWTTISSKKELESVGELSEVCSQITWNFCIWQELDDLTSCGPWDQSQKWAQACDKRLAKLISHIHHTTDFRQYCHVENAAQHCRLGSIPRLRFCWLPRGLKINFRRCLVYFWKQNICSSQLDVQETNISFS